MIRETATVTGPEGSQGVINIQRQSVCGHCTLNNGCGTGAIGRMLGHRSKSLIIPSEKNLKPGDQVISGQFNPTILQVIAEPKDQISVL